MDEPPRVPPDKISEKAGHRDRLRQKFLNGGLTAFLDYEIVELLLTLGTPRRDCKRAAREALREFKTFGGVLEARGEDLQRIPGIGIRNVFGLKLVHEVSRRFLRDKMMRRPVCHSSQEVHDYLSHALRDAKTERFKVLFLDPKNQVIEEKTLFEGTVDSSAVYPREVIRDALRYEASALIFAHNHPSGIALRPLSSFTTTLRAIPTRPSATGRSHAIWCLPPGSFRSRSSTISSSAGTAISVSPTGV